LIELRFQPIFKSRAFKLCFFTFIFASIDFFYFFGYHINNEVISIPFLEVLDLRKSNTFTLILGMISAAVAVAAIVTTTLLFFEKKKKDEEELEHYLDYSIQ